MPAPGPPPNKDYVMPDATIAAYARQAGFRGQALVTAVAVALAESGGRPYAVNKNDNGTTDTGLWQINSIHQGTPAVDNDHPLTNPITNARAAYIISGGGLNWKPWVAFTKNRHLPFMTRAAAAAKEAESGTGVGGLVDDLTPDVDIPTPADVVEGAGDVIRSFFWRFVYAVIGVVCIVGAIMVLVRGNAAAIAKGLAK